MRIGLISDTHIPEAGPELWPQAYRAFDECDAILHAGDIYDISVIDKLQQIAPTWWFNKIVYLPQEPDFINDTFRNNFLVYNPDLGANDIHQLLGQVDLLSLVDENPEGLDQKI